MIQYTLNPTEKREGIWSDSDQADLRCMKSLLKYHYVGRKPNEKAKTSKGMGNSLEVIAVHFQNWLPAASYH